MAADRFYQLIKHSLSDNTLFYRVIPDFIAQFAISDTSIRTKWTTFKVTDEPVISRNKRGTIAFARFGKDSRGMALFINLKDNPKLETYG